jgi:acylphosphatase
LLDGRVELVAEGAREELLAFQKSGWPGTANAVKQAKAASLKVTVVSLDSETGKRKRK